MAGLAVATRPIFVPSQHKPFVELVNVQFEWAPGFAQIQKAKNILAMHEAARQAGLNHVLEVSSKSGSPMGQALSAFRLRILSTDHGTPTVEAAFQASKVFEHGGPFRDLLSSPPSAGKKDPRLSNSGELVGFEFEGEAWPLRPPTSFYDWLYLKSLNQIDDIEAKLARFDGFTDIEFNPKRSINCQARSCALFVSLAKNHLIDEAMSSPERFRETIGPGEPSQEHLEI